MKHRRCLLLVVVSFGVVPAVAQARIDAASDAQRTLERAIQLAGPTVAGLPIVLATNPPDGASDGVEAWLLRGPDERPRQLGVYSESETFRCASGVTRTDYQCLLKVASLLVHEAWHYRNGPEEARAYDAQIEFLIFHGGSSTTLSGVRRARNTSANLGTASAPSPAPAEPASSPHVRSTTREVKALIETGQAISATFRGLIASLDESDVILYVSPKRQTMAPEVNGFLSHAIVSAGHHRYLRIALDVSRPTRSLVPLLAHEIQHAVEVAHAPDVHDTAGIEHLFARLGIPFGCGRTNCYETQAAKDVEALVSCEMAEAVPFRYRGTARR